MASTIRELSAQDTVSIADLYTDVRARTMQIVAPLEIEDYVIQTAEFMSPPRWHIGHTSWFFETVLQQHKPGYRVYSEDFLFYFNSYYEGFGVRIERPKRGTKSRPTVKETIAYRNHIDEQMLAILNSPDADKVLSLVRLGLEHEMQHQELLVYDIKHLLCDQFAAPVKPLPKSSTRVEGMAEIEGGLVWLGYDKNQAPRSRPFAFDNEKPAHQVFIQDFAIDKAPVSNGDFLEFINDGGYENFRWWFSEGWEAVNREQWRAPLYWELHDGEWMIRDFSGLHSAAGKKDEPVCHASYFEASAFAKWAGKRLPTEAEWEHAACYDARRKVKHAFPWGETDPDSGNTNFFENGYWSVAPIGAFPERRERLRLPADDWRRVGMDHFRLRALSGIQVRV
jgi:ergothioneine biosynthesis protein EgtB